MKKLYRILILPTKEPSHLYISGGNLHYEEYPDKIVNAGNQHLYIISDEEIKEGDWVLGDFPDNPIGIVTSKYGDEFDVKDSKGNIHGLSVYDSKKIIATTDKSLLTYNRVKRKGESCSLNNNCKYPSCQVPQIPTIFIEEFVKQNGNIKKILVEYEEVEGIMLTGEDSYYQLKLREDNTVTISPSRTYTFQEVIRLIRHFDIEKGRDIPTKEFDDWIEQNLKL